ncbi:MAG: hypothetical protein ACRD47_03935 [Nitrososphaeraceae archaeon]
MSRNARERSISQRARSNNQVLETGLPHQNENTLADQLDIEIECSRCRDIMELFSKFDYLSYHCNSCRLELNVN